MSQGGLPAPLVVPNSGRWLGNDGSWSTFYAHVGTPPQYFHVLPSFNGQTLYVPIDQDCSPERMNIIDCGGQRGVEVFQSRPSPGFQKNVSSSWKELGIYRLGLGTNLGLSGNAYFGYDSFGMGSNQGNSDTKVEQLAVAAYATADFWVGQLGLSMFPIIVGETEQPHSLLARLKDEGKIPSLSFRYQAGAPYRFTKVPGSIILGDYDRTHHSNKTLLVPSTLDVIVGLQKITSTFPNRTTSTLLSTGIVATINTNVQDIWLPASVCDTIASTLGLTYFDAAQRYVLTDTAHTALQNTPPTLSFTIGTSASGGDTITINIPYAAFDLQARYPIFGTQTNYFPLRRAANDTQYTLGRAFLQEVYISVDWERDVFNISQAVFASPPLPLDVVTVEPKNRTDSLVPRPGQARSSKLSPRAIAGIAVGVLVLMGMIAGLGWWMYRRRRAARREDGLAQTLQTDEKKDPGNQAPKAVEKSPRTDLDLEGRMVPEIYAPVGEKHELQGAESEKRDEQVMEVVEADVGSPVYELPSGEVSRADGNG
ncbi:acid protease [Setomelanomma holmii]|uniref:Acid protease n=1 Tax=Setomelanomma holmii TaxID=210430 RepID=A0A9P4LST2_9PLEO|nr:acid protease [Setomelanomma holmii]